MYGKCVYLLLLPPLFYGSVLAYAFILAIFLDADLAYLFD